MVNLWKQIKDRRNKELSKGVDGNDILETLINNRDQFNPKERKEIVTSIRKGAIKAGKDFLKRAFEEKLMDKKQWKHMKSLGIGYADIGTVLHAYYGRKDNHYVDDELIIVTSEGSPTHKNKELLELKFGVTIKTISESLKLMEDKYGNKNRTTNT